MKVARIGSSLASIVSIKPPRRRMIDPIPLMETGYEGRTDQQALWSDFMSVGLGMRVAMRKRPSSSR